MPTAVNRPTSSDPTRGRVVVTGGAGFLGSHLCTELLDRGAEVVIVERVRFADDRPVVYSVDRVPLALVPEAIRGNLGASLFDLLENVNHGVRNGRAKLLPVLAGPPEAAQLQVKEGVPLLYFDEVDYDINGTPVLASFEWHTSDVFEMWLNRRAQPPAHQVQAAPSLSESRT